MSALHQSEAELKAGLPTQASRRPKFEAFFYKKLKQMTFSYLLVVFKRRMQPGVFARHCSGVVAGGAEKIISDASCECWLFSRSGWALSLCTEPG